MQFNADAVCLVRTQFQHLKRAANRVQEYAGKPPHGLDVTGLVAWARALVIQIEQDGIAVLTPGDLTPRLRS
jgi:hypothetical protein